jgi:hypothetical protein
MIPIQGGIHNCLAPWSQFPRPSKMPGRFLMPIHLMQRQRRIKMGFNKIRINVQGSVKRLKGFPPLSGLIPISSLQIQIRSRWMIHRQ